jgi:hypothetical protein
MPACARPAPDPGFLRGLAFGVPLSLGMWVAMFLAWYWASALIIAAR